MDLFCIQSNDSYGITKGNIYTLFYVGDDEIAIYNDQEIWKSYTTGLGFLQCFQPLKRHQNDND